jgi:hypothetical protein
MGKIISVNPFQQHIYLWIEKNTVFSSLLRLAVRQEFSWEAQPRAPKCISAKRLTSLPMNAYLKILQPKSLVEWEWG